MTDPVIRQESLFWVTMTVFTTQGLCELKVPIYKLPMRWSIWRVNATWQPPSPAFGLLEISPFKIPTPCGEKLYLNALLNDNFLLEGSLCDQWML